MIKAFRDRGDRVRQGDVIANVQHIEKVTRTVEFVEISTVTFPLVVVLSQDCDLEQDYRTRQFHNIGSSSDHDKILVSALVAPLYNFDHVKQGDHLSDLGRRSQKLNSERGRYVKSNQSPRYHYLEFPQNVPVVDSVVDFKHYFSVSLDYLAETKVDHFICKIAEIYREDLSLRFANFLCRIGLPDPALQ